MLYISLFVPLLLNIILATYIIPRILVVSVKKDLVIPSETKGKGRLRVPRLGGVSLIHHRTPAVILRRVIPEYGG